MKKKIQRMVFCLMAFLPFLSFAQILQGSVHSIFNVGTYDYAYIYVNDQSVFYKTAAYPANTLALNMQVDMNFDSGQPEPYNTYITSAAVQIGVYADKLETENFDMPLTSQYGMPVLENEILFFSSQAHFDEFYGILTNFATSPYEEMWDLLMIFEEQYPGFVSFNTHLENQYHTNSEDVSSTNFDNYHNSDYFGDLIIKSIVNQFSEVGIGNEIHTLVLDEKLANSITIIVPRIDLAVLSEKRNISISDLSKIKIPHHLFDVYIGEVRYEAVFEEGAPIKVVNVTSNINALGELSHVEYDSKVIATNLDCKVFEKQAYVNLTRKTDSTQFMVPGNFQGYATIYWGDGDSTILDIEDWTVEANVKYASGNTDATSHTYQSLGSYTITAKVTFLPEIQNPFWVNDYELVGDAVLVDNACSERENHPDAKITHIPNNYNYFLVCDSWISKWPAYRTVGSFSEAWRIKPNGNFEKVNGNIWVQVFAVFRNDDCTQYDSDDEDDDKYGKHVQAVMYYWFSKRKFHISNGDTYSYNRYEKTTTIYEGIPLNPCE